MANVGRIFIWYVNVPHWLVNVNKMNIQGLKYNAQKSLSHFGILLFSVILKFNKQRANTNQSDAE